MLLTKAGCHVISQSDTPLHSGWRLASSKPGAIQNPSELENPDIHWLPASVPGTVAQTLFESGDWDFKRPRDFDDQDWWYCCSFQKSAQTANEAAVEQWILRFDGLATLAQVWLNGECILNAENMFVAYEVDVGKLLRADNCSDNREDNRADNELFICFRAVNTDLAKKRPRPRWKTKLVSNQQLRWMRTSLLGRIPGWSPPVAPVGPWRAITLHSRTVHDVTLRSYLEEGTGVVDFKCDIADISDSTISANISAAGQSTTLTVEKCDSGYRLQGQLRIADVPLWWPHTHGEPVLYPCAVAVELGGQTSKIDCGRVGFRHIEVNDNDAGFRINVNGHAVFCRGACWTINDIVALDGSEERLKHSLQMAKDAGMNMIRVGGTMVYEQELFYELCDELGIMVWQDFMFANMDYPVEDEYFRASVETEIVQQLQRFRSHPCIAVYCGNSEVEQQAAMLGMPKELWRSTLFSQLIPDLCKRWHGDVPYVPSTPSGGTLPFHVSKGITHYYGVGAYMRPVMEVRRAKVRFTPECLGFANVPENSAINLLMEGQSPVAHHPLWKSRVPRDSGAGWDFEDIRDFYFEKLFQENAVQTRCFDMPRYLSLSRITTGELMEQVFAEWRSAYSNCGGALIWFYKDLWPGAGWGVVDSSGVPKACYYYLKRVLQPRAIVLTDEGLDGIHVHIVNETNEDLESVVEVALLRDGQSITAKAEKACKLAPRSVVTMELDELLNGFYDVSYAYRFGPPNHDVVIATLTDKDGRQVSQAFQFPGNRKLGYSAVNLSADAAETQDGDYLLRLQSDTFLQAVHFDVNGYSPSDNYFHLAPGKPREVVFRKTGDSTKKFKGYVESLSLREPKTITVTK